MYWEEKRSILNEIKKNKKISYSHMSKSEKTHARTEKSKCNHKSSNKICQNEHAHITASDLAAIVA